MKILYKSKDFVIVDKPAEVLSVPSRLGASDPRPCCGIDLQNQLRTQIYPIHRLDFEVSGLIMFGLNKEAHRLANRWFENNLVIKKYEALTPYFDSIEMGKKYEWHSKILRGKKRAYEHEHGKESVTLGEPILQLGEKVKWLLSPLTGRPHQLRFELFKQGIPIIGDTLYGSEFKYSPGIALKAVELNFEKCDLTNLELDTKVTAPPLN